ncbi:MAG: DnaD domain protein [Bacilli bacterium]|nr:DnaD domain protein [Bacilli bacterium]
MNIDIMKESNLVFPSFLIPVVKSLKLEINDLILLLYFWNYKKATFDLTVINQTIKLSEEEILTSFNNLMQKKVIKLDIVKDDNEKRNEIISLEYFYVLINEKLERKEKESTKEDIYSIFERDLGKTLSSMDFEYINGWIEKGFSEELILGALKKALFYNASDLRYIDKVLYDWKRKGYKTMDEVNNTNQNKIIESENKEFYDYINSNDYNWLDEE